MQPFQHPARRSTPEPASPDLSHVEKESHFGSDFASRQAREAAENIVKDYEIKRDT